MQVDDLDAFVTDVVGLYPAGTTVFLGGQSMGGLIALHEALRDQTRLNGIILTSAAVNVEWTPVLKCAHALSAAAMVSGSRAVCDPCRSTCSCATFPNPRSGQFNNGTGGCALGSSYTLACPHDVQYNVESDTKVVHILSRV